MQFNSPFTGPQWQWTSNFPSHKLYAAPPVLVGEGDLVSVTSPNGAVFYFLPANRRQPYIPVQYPNNVNWPEIQEMYFIRSISNSPIPGPYFNSQVPTVPEDFAISYNINGDKPFDRYYQTFHNDSATSTSDLHYFYPSLRTRAPLSLCAAVQVDTNTSNYCGRCSCSTGNGGNTYSRTYRRRSNEDMSVDEPGGPHIQYKNKHSKKCQMEYKHESCECNNKVYSTSDKLTATYADNSCGTSGAGRGTRAAGAGRQGKLKNKPGPRRSCCSNCSCQSESDICSE